MKARRVIAAAAMAALWTVQAGDYAYETPKITDVKVTGGFWLPRLETNRLVTIKTDFEKCELARIPNFRNAAARQVGTFKGIPFDDSDVYKVVEGAAYSLATHPDPELEKYVDELIGWFAKAQEDDGYLYTARTLGMANVEKFSHLHMMGRTRWANLPQSHELYNVGHLYEAAVAWFEATGKRNLLDVAIKSADLIDRTFGPEEGKLKDTSGHEEIELGLCKLYRATGEVRYLNLAKFLLEMRGRTGKAAETKVFAQSGDLADGKALGAPGSYNQNHMPVTMQREAVGHAVRAAYLYCGMADVAALSGNADYLKAIDAIWENVAMKKLHLNGSIGARRRGEAFGANYELPNETAYLETCAGIGNALWNMRMFLMHGDAKYVDILELAVYNGIISGISLGGDEFFYPNPLASKGGYKRSKWFACSCCPVNIVRFLPQVPQFAYAKRGNAAYVNLFVSGEAKLALKCGDVKIGQKTAYPWKGDVEMSVTPPRNGAEFTLNVRIPGWCVGRPVPSDLYEQTQPGSLADFSVSVNGRPFTVVPRMGYCSISRRWKAGDRVAVKMNMPVRRVRAHASVADDRGRLAVMRGPILYCAEGVDNDGTVLNKTIAADASFSVSKCDILGNVYPALTVPAAASFCSGSRVYTKPATMKLVPYFAWCHRGAGEMQTWFPEKADAKFAKVTDKVRASYCFAKDNPEAVVDGILPSSSSDVYIPRLTFWPHNGTEEWVERVFDEVSEAKGVEVYWFSDERHRGGCRLPVSWKVQYRADDSSPWIDAAANGPVKENGFCTLDFSAPVKAKALRIVTTLQPKFSTGILEWRVKW